MHTTAVCFAFLGLSTGALASPPGERRVRFEKSSPLVDAAPEEARVLGRVVALAEAWLDGDSGRYAAQLAPSVTRSSEETGAILRGRDAVVRGMATDRGQFEQPTGALELELVLGDVAVDVRGDVATVSYDVAVSGRGRSRWEFDDRWVVLQAFERGEGGDWRLLHQSDAADLDDPDSDDLAFDFDFVYPVKDLRRAVAFYEPFLGAPEYVSADRAAFAFGVPRFILDATELGGLAPVRAGLPNGYGVFFVDDLEATAERLADRGVTFQGPSRSRGPDLERVALDPAGNVFVLSQRRYRADLEAAPEWSVPAGAPPAVAALVAAWVHADRNALAATLSPTAAWFDDTRSDRGSIAARPRRDVLDAVEADWQRFDRGPRGLWARWTVDDLDSTPLGDRTLVRYRRTLSSDGPHPMREEALVTHVIEQGRVTLTFIARASSRRALARGLDYTGYPVEDLTEARAFYEETMSLGEPYADESYFGFWSTHSVFGIYESDSDEDGIPTRGVANGYVCFWVGSAQQTYDQLRERGARFPRIGSIADEAGVDAEPGYIQVLASDSEGNAVVFGEYTGK